ncbi:MAG TPA: helix-turn-helix domain-containing protein [Polyangiaceae bacterium]|nr:helix-turn-helix domain-containing protein [Polyangiaceae bacterium]
MALILGPGPHTEAARKAEEAEGQQAPVAPAASTESPIMTVDELAALLRVNRKTAYDAIARGEIPGVRRVGRTFRVSREAVLGWLREGRVSRSRR